MVSLMRRPRLPNSRPDWRDPACPCIRRYTMADGTIRTEVDPDYERRYREHLIEIDSRPTYDKDPTYHMRRTK